MSDTATKLPAAPAYTPKPANDTHVLDVAEAEKVLPLPMMLKKVSEGYHKPLQSIVMEIARASFGAGKLTSEEYFTLRLFDDANITGDKSWFCGMAGMRKLWPAANYQPEWHGVITDKLAFDTLMNGYGLPAIKMRAYYFTEGFRVPAQRMLRQRDDLKAFLTDPASYPFFSKPRASSLSLGSASATGYNAETGHIELLNGKSVELDKFIDDIVTHFGTGYMFQERVIPHQGVRDICGDRLATVRVYTINGENGPEVFRVCWKVPAGKNVADNFWLTGNILAAVDYQTGKINRAIQGFALDQVEITHHPDTNAPLVGATIPNFQAVLDLSLEAARIFNDIRVIGWDIAPTEAGGVIVEGNFAPDFKLVQMAERRGILDDRMTAFLAHCKKERTKYEAAQKARAREILREDLVKFKKSAWMR